MLRFGLDVGTNSIGWCVFKIENDVPIQLLAANSRIFSDGRDPQNKEPLAVTCRIARGARVRRDRMTSRKKLLLEKLLALKLIPQDETARQTLKLLNPYELRDKAITKTLTPHEFGRVLMSFAQRRGFKSNRKSDSKEDVKKTQPDLDALDKALKDTGLTLGQYLWQERLEKGKPARARAGEGIYPRRQHYEDEFEKIHSKQSPHHPDVSEKDWEELADILFFQRPMREQEVGFCQVYFELKERRAPIALPSYQKFRIAQNIANLQIVSPDRGNKRRLDLNQRKLLVGALQGQKTMAFGKLRKLLKLQDGETFNLESERREKLEGNETAAVLSDKKRFDGAWFDLSDKEQDDIVTYLLDANEAEAVFQKARVDWNLSEEQARNVAALTPEDFPKGYARFGHRALHELVEILTEQGISTTEAIMELRRNRGDNSMRRDRLPYYGEVMPESMIPSPKRGDDDTKKYGKINNPTVLIGLNQIRKLINELIDIYGKPDEIFLELARSLKLNRKTKEELEKFQRKNQKLNDEALNEMKDVGVPTNDENIKRYKLWKELSKDVNDRCCPYSRKRISKEILWSNAIEVEHILPESLTFDSSMKNLTVAFKEANRAKGNRAPDEAFNIPGSPYSYQDIIDFVQRSEMSPGKKRRFDPGAMKKFRESEDGFIARQLTDTQYLAKIARKYLLAVCEKVHVLPGQLTARIRHEWGLNSILAPKGATPEERDEKNRKDHRHHAIDAIVIACTDYSMLMRASKASARNQSGSVEFETPWEREQFRRDVAEVINKAVVSHKPDRGIQAKLHEDTYYGIIKDGSKNDYERENNYNVVKRGDFRGHFAKVAPDKVVNKIALIRDPVIRKELELELPLATDVEDLARIVDAYAKRKGIRRIRLLKKEATVLPITHRSTAGQEFEKGVVPGSNHHVAFWRLPNGEIKARGCSFFEVNSIKGDLNKLKPHPAAKLICRLYKKDLVRILKNGKEETCVITKLNPSEGNETITMRVHSESNGNGFAISFSQFKNYKLRKIRITPAGRIYDSGSMF